jgi:predicted DNA-binding transcriptional regulator YafY
MGPHLADNGRVDTAARVLKLLSLLTTRQSWRGEELAERLGVTDRTVRRDVDRLRDLGYPVHAEPGASGGYRLGAGARLPPLLLDDDAAVAMALGLRAAATGAVAGMEDGYGSTTSIGPAPVPGATSSRTAWCIPGGAGTWWPATSTGTTGAVSASTGCPSRP